MMGWREDSVEHKRMVWFGVLKAGNESLEIGVQKYFVCFVRMRVLVKRGGGV
jgi:hypothetical protein